MHAWIKSLNVTPEANQTIYQSYLHRFGLADSNYERDILLCAGDQVNVCQVSVKLCQLGRYFTSI